MPKLLRISKLHVPMQTQLQHKLHQWIWRPNTFVLSFLILFLVQAVNWSAVKRQWCGSCQEILHVNIKSQLQCMPRWCYKLCKYYGPQQKLSTMSHWIEYTFGNEGPGGKARVWRYGKVWYHYYYYIIIILYLLQLQATAGEISCFRYQVLQNFWEPSCFYTLYSLVSEKRKNLVQPQHVLFAFASEGGGNENSFEPYQNHTRSYHIYLRHTMHR